MVDSRVDDLFVAGPCCDCWFLSSEDAILVEFYLRDPSQLVLLCLRLGKSRVLDLFLQLQEFRVRGHLQADFVLHHFQNEGYG